MAEVPRQRSGKTDENLDTKKHAMRVLGCFGADGVVFPTLDFASAREILDQDAGGGNQENILKKTS
ncbi:hypothetical protein CYL31_09445 [Marinomonas sp. A3A]|uniref:hypothetical protein n=1 Tax=Marinomonas sp. A3A TaxID=2065312 RepID=UPI001BB4425E|nr:hypothetical protein [Marinomonas sp. A3A]QUX91620.1 hypothetical protein CYL31_09445 [Marinomonas sp. A3A]